MAPDLRGHGLSSSENEADLSAATLAADVVAIWQQLFGSGRTAAAAAAAAAEFAGAAEASGSSNSGGRSTDSGPPPTVLVGHSMGGAIAVHAAALNGKRAHQLGRSSPMRAH